MQRSWNGLRAHIKTINKSTNEDFFIIIRSFILILNDIGCVACKLLYCFYFFLFLLDWFVTSLSLRFFTTKINKEERNAVFFELNLVFLRQSKLWHKYNGVFISSNPLILTVVYTEHDKHCVVQTISKFKP